MLFGGVAIGTYAGGVNGGNLVVFFNADAATPAAVQALTAHILYANTSENPSTLPRTVLFLVTDGDGNANGGNDVATASATINITAVNDGPILGGIAAWASYSENAAPVLDEDADRCR